MPSLPSSLELSDVQIPLLCTFFSSFQLAVEWNILRPFRVFSDFKEPLTFFLRTLKRTFNVRLVLDHTVFPTLVSALT
jgi:hypothetical protein